MAILSDSIERFIIELMSEYEGIAELQRNDLATYFECAPSQINYVLATRFSPDKGYIIQSKRGGGGYIKIIRLSQEKSEVLLYLLTEAIEESVSERQAFKIVDGLAQRDIIDNRQFCLMRAALSDKALVLPSPLKEKIRSNLLKQMVISLMEV